MAATKSCAILVSVSCLWFLLAGSANCQRFKPNTKFNYKFRDTIHLDDKNHFQFFDTLANHIIRREDVPYAEARLVQNLNGKASKPVNVVANYDNDLENKKIENNGLSDAPKIDSQSSSTSHATFKAESDTGFINTPDSLLTNKRYLDSIASDLIKKESAKRYLDSIASDIIKKNSDKRFLESIATEILKKESNKRYLDSIAGDLIKKNSQVGVPDYFQAGENINLPSIILQPELPFYPNEAPFPYYPSEEYDLTSFRNQNGQNYDDVFQGAGLYQNGDDYIWSDDRTSNNPKIGENMQEISKTELVQPSKTLKFNDSFDQFQSEQNGSTAPKRFLESIASEIIKKDDGENSHAGNQKRYLDDIGSSLLKRNSEDRTEEQGVQTPKRYLDQIGSNLIKRDQGVETKRMKLLKVRMFPSTHGNPKDLEAKFIARNNDFRGSQNKFKRYLDDISSSLIKKSDNGGEISEQGTNKRYLDGIASSLIKKESNKRYLDGIGGSLIKKESNKRYLDGIASSLIKKENGATHSDDKRYLDGIASSLIKKESNKRYLDGIASSLIKKEDGAAHSDDKRYLDGIASSLIKKESNKRYLDGIASSLIKKEDGATHSDDKRYLDGIASSLIKKEDGTTHSDDKRYLDGIASSLIKKESNKRYLDGIASSLIKKENGAAHSDDKRYLDGIASSLIKKESNKRYLDGIASSLIKKEDGATHSDDKRYLDGIASSLIKKEDGTTHSDDKRYLDGIASSLIKKESNKRYLDGIASSLIKKEDGTTHSDEKRYLDGIGSSLIKKEDDKRYLDGIASSLIKKDSNENGAENEQKRYLDGIASSLIKKESSTPEADKGSAFKSQMEGTADINVKSEDKKEAKDRGDESESELSTFREDSKDSEGEKSEKQEKRYLDGIASSLIKKDMTKAEKRYLDSIADSLVKKNKQGKRYLDGIAGSLIKKSQVKEDKRYLDGIASSLIKKQDSQKRYLDGIASSLIKKDTDHKRHFDGIASSLIKKEVNGQKRYFDGISSSLIKKKDNVQGNHDSSKRYLDEIASSLVKKEIVSSKNKRYLDDIGNSLIKKDDDTVQNKRYFDDIGSSLVKKEKSEKRYLDGIASSLIKKSAGEKRYLDSIAGTLIKKESHPAQQVNQARILKRKFEVTDDVMDGSRENHDLERRSVGSSKIDGDFLKSDTPKVRRKRDVSIMPFRYVLSPSMSKLSARRRRKRFIDNIASDIVYKRFGSSMGNPQQEDPLEEYENFMDHQQNIRNQRLREDKNDLQGLHIFSDTEEDTSTNMPPEVENPSNFDSRITGMFWNFNQGDEDSNTPKQPLSSQLARPESYLYSQVLYPLLPNIENQGPTGLVSQNDLSVFPSEKPNLESQRTALDVDSNPESYKSIGNRDTLSFARAIASPYIDENGAEFFKNNNIFKQPQLDPMASSAFRKHYLDTLASDLVNLLEQDTREPTRGYNTNGKVLILDPYEQASRGKRFIDSLASDLLYKRKYWRQANPMSINSEPARYSSNVNYPRLSIRGRLRTFQSKSAPKGKKLSTTATSWRGRPTLMTAMLATGKGPNDEDTKVYLRHAMKDYVRDVSKKVLARAKIIGEKLHRAPLARSNDVVQPRGNKYYWKQGDNHSTRRDFFDSLAGDLLT